MTELSPKARALLSRTASDFEPSQADRERLRGALRARMLAGAGAAAAVPAAVKAATSTAPPAAAGTTILGATSAGTVVSKLVLVKFGVALLVVGATATATAVVATRHDAAPANAPVVVSSPLPTSAPSSATPLDVAPAPTAEAVPSAEVVVAPRPRARVVTSMPVAASKPSSQIAEAKAASSSSPSEDAFDAEMAVLREVQLALRSHDGARALAALDAHDARFGRGALIEERAAARVIALCELGRTSEASAARASFFSSYPRSPQAERVRTACGPSD